VRKHLLICVLLILTLCFVVQTVMAGKKLSTKDSKKVNVSDTYEAQKLLCKKVSSIIKNRTIDRYMPARVDTPGDPRGSEYLNSDIDGDGVADKILYSSGSGESVLEVKTSRGEEYIHEELGSMMVVKFDNKVYVLVTYWGSETIGLGGIAGQRLYQLTKSGVEIVCGTIN